MLTVGMLFKRILIGIILLFGFNEIVSAQSFEQWSTPKIIPGFSTGVWTPYVVADQNRTVHAFVSDLVGEDSNPQLAIFYNKWTRQSGWSEPIDIILPAKGEARVKGVYLDQKGAIHLIFFEGEDREGTINYSTAPAVDAANAYSWSEPVPIGTATITPDEAAIAGDDQGNLYVVYAGKQNSHGLYFIHSDDGGLTWTEPSEIFLTYRWDLWPTALQLYIDNGEDLHVVWGLGNITGNSIAVYHRRLDTNRMVWGDTVELAKITSGEVDTPSIIEYDDELFVIYHDDRPTTRHMRRSSDGGQSWTDPVRLFPHVGSNGAASLIIDGNNVMHMFFGNRLDSTGAHGMWHSDWLGNRWSDPEAIVSGPVAPGFDPARPRSVISQGNTMFVVWQTEPGQINLGTSLGDWYSYATLDTPELPLVPFKSEAAKPAIQPGAEAVTLTVTPAPSEPSPSPEANIEIHQEPGTVQTNPGMLVLLGLLPAFLLSVGILILNRFRH